MAVVVSPTTCTFRLKLNAGTSASGAPLLKSMSLFTPAKLKTSLDNAALAAALDVTGYLESCLLHPLHSTEYVATSSITLDE